MTKTTEEEKLGEKGLIDVRREFVNGGFACDEVKSDYGEDLIVQSNYKNLVDPFRIYVQVKARGRNSNDSGNWSLYIDKDHLLKWIQSPELVVLVMWMEVDNAMRFFVPKDNFTEWRLFTDEQKGYVVNFDATKALALDAVSHLAWRARFDNYNRMILNNRSRISIDPNDEINNNIEIQQDDVAIAIGFLVKLQLLARDAGAVALSDVFSATVMDLLVEGLSQAILDHIAEDHAAMAMCVILKRAARLAPSTGVPSVLLEASIVVLKALIARKFDEAGSVESGPLTPAELQDLQQKLDELAVRTRGE